MRWSNPHFYAAPGRRLDADFVVDDGFRVCN
jgi:hypothetical protein